MKPIEITHDNIVSEIVPALRVEFKKVRRSRVLWMTAIVFAFITFIGGLFMFILKNPELARSLGLVGAKAQLFGSSADWSSFLSFILLMVSVGGLVIFGFIFVWIFGREFGDKTVYDLLSLPTSRVTIVIVKTITAACWSIVLILMVFLLTLGIGAILQLPGWSTAIAFSGLGRMLITGLLTVLLCISFSLVASVTRSYLPAIGCIFLVLLLGEVFNRLGYGDYFPWAVPTLYSGAAGALTGQAATTLGPVSYILVGFVGVLSLIASGAWWIYADQT